MIQIGGPTGTKFLSLVCHTESKTRVPLTLAVVAARHPLLDGDTHQVLLCILGSWALGEQFAATFRDSFAQQS